MKWSVQQLEKLTLKPYPFSYTIDFSELAKNVSDMISISEVVVNGVITRLTSGTYHFVYHVHAPMQLECALTLDPIDYVIDEDFDEIFSTEDVETYFLIENNTVDFDQVIWTNILVEKPLAISKPDAYDILRERGIPIIDSDEDFTKEE